MTPTQRAAMEQALKALKPIAAGNINSVISDAAYAAATSLIAALAEPAPVHGPVTDEENERFSQDVSNFRGADPAATKYALGSFLRRRAQAQQPAAEINQCDGCRAGQEMRGSLHVDRDSKAVMTCQASKYQQPAPVQEPFENDRVMTVVYYDPSKEDVDSIMSHPKAKWFGWCHAPYQRDHYKSLLEAQQPAPQAQQPAPPADVPMLTDAEWTGVLGFTEWTTDPTRVALMNIARAAEKAVRQKAGMQ